MRISPNSGLRLAAVILAIVAVPHLGWAAGSVTKNCPVEPAQNVAIASGETYFGTNCKLSTTGDVDSFQFTASAGDTYSMVAGLGASPISNVCLTLYAPGVPATVLYTGCSAFSAPYFLSAVGTTQKLATAGTYTIVVSESANGIITYGLSVERLSPAPPDAIALTLAKNVTGDVTPLTAQDAYTFAGSTTGTYEVVASVPSTSTTNTCFAIYDPTGTLLSYTCTAVSAPYFIYSISADVTPTLDGTYVVVMSAAGNDTTVNYNLEVSCILGMCVVPPPKCSLTDTLTYNATTQTLTMNFTVGTPSVATWNGWLSTGNTIVPLWSTSQPITEPAVAVTKTETSLPKSGKVGVLSTLTTATGGITCSSWSTINTGTP